MLWEQPNIIVIFGGYDDDSNSLHDVWYYSVEKNKFEEKEQQG